MALNRRDIIKIGGVAGLAATLPLARTGLTGSASRLPTSKMPAMFTLPFQRPAELAPVGNGLFAGNADGVLRSYPRYEIAQQFTVASILPGYKTPVFGYNGLTPGPTLRMQRGTPAIVRQTNVLQQPPPAP